MPLRLEVFDASLATLVLFDDILVDAWPVYSLECSELHFVYSLVA